MLTRSSCYRQKPAEDEKYEDDFVDSDKVDPLTITEAGKAKTDIKQADIFKV